MLGQSAASDVPAAVRTAAAKAAAPATPRASLEPNPGIVLLPGNAPRGGCHVDGMIVHNNPPSTRRRSSSTPVGSLLYRDIVRAPARWLRSLRIDSRFRSSLWRIL